MKQSSGIRQWVKTGEPWVWLNAAAVSASMMMVVGLLALIAYHGLGHFWPADLMEAELVDGDKSTIIMGEVRATEIVPAQQIRESGVRLPADITQVKRILLKQGNRDIYHLDFRWFLERDIANINYPEDLIVFERREWGDLYGRLVAIKEHGQALNHLEKTDELYAQLQSKLARILDLYEQARDISVNEIGNINYQLEQLRLKEKKLQLNGALSNERQAIIEQERQALNQSFSQLQIKANTLYEKISPDSIIVRIASGQNVEIALEKIIQVIKPNEMDTIQKLSHYFHQLWRFISENPREANTEGGIFPAIFGTVLMVLIMSVMVTPLGVMAAIYMHEYAAQGVFIRLVRIAVNNLAGVPSIVYGVFGLGFFVYFIGGSIDSLFYSEASPAPVFGTPGLLWASLTLALLTLPVVIVSTEEGLARVPNAIRDGSLALGATRFETLWHTVLPMASPAMITGVILAVARAAGEVAPLMLVGVVKLAPSLAVDANAPFLHLDRKFMHLGFHIYDVGFQSPNIEAARPLVYTTALLLVVVIILLNLTAIRIRNRLREKYKNYEH